MYRILFGDNQFFGVNHMSEEKARLQAARFQDLQAIIDVLDVVYEEGIRVFMCTTQDRMVDVCEHFRQHKNRYPGFKFYPCMPYAHKYANAITEYGLLGALQRFLPSSKFAAIFKGSVSVATGDVEGIAQLLIDSEMHMFRGLETPIIFLQNVVTDLLLGLGFKDGFRIFADHVRRKYDAEAGFITMNLPRLLDALDELGLENPIVCSNINKIGFRMSGGIDLYERTIRNRKFRPIAMSVLASGALQPREAIEYIAGQQRIESIVFGASSRANIRQTKLLIDELYPQCADAEPGMTLQPSARSVIVAANCREAASDH
jgi:hypothetical protein